MNEMRKDRRAPASLKVKYKSATVDDFIEHFGADVSRGGIFIKTKKPLETGALLKFEFQLQNGSALIHGVGRVAWRRPEDRARPDLPAGMGIKFIKLDDDSRRVIERIELRHGVGSRFDQTEAAEFAAPLSSLPPNPARSGLATPPAPPPVPVRSRPADPSQDKPTFRPPPPAISSIPPALADAWPQSTSTKPERSIAARGSGAQSLPKGALGSVQPSSARKAAPAAMRNAASRDTSEFLASAFSVGGAGHDVRSQARVQVERARRDPQSVDLANELFGDLSEPSEQASRQPDAASDLASIAPAADTKAAAAHERSLSDRIPSIEELVDEASSTGMTPSFQRKGDTTAQSPVQEALSSPPRTSAMPLSLSLSDKPNAREQANVETIRPAANASKSGVLAWTVGVIAFIGVAAGTFFVMRGPQADSASPGVATAPSTAVATTDEVPPAPESEADKTAEHAAPPTGAAELETKPEPGAKPTPINVNITSEPRGAQVSVDGKTVGKTPVSVSLTTTVPAEVSVKSVGYATQVQRITPQPGMKAQHFELAPLSYDLIIATDPPGATVRVKDQSAISPAPLSLGHIDGTITASIEKDGFQRTSRTVRLEEFQEQGGAMRADLKLSLSPLPSAVRRKPAPARPSPPVIAPQPPPEPPGTTQPPVVLVKPEPAPAEPNAPEPPQAAPKPADVVEPPPSKPEAAPAPAAPPPPVPANDTPAPAAAE